MNTANMLISVGLGICVGGLVYAAGVVLDSYREYLWRQQVRHVMNDEKENDDE